MKRHVPYRNSKLTFLLRDALSARGNSSTTIIGTVASENRWIQETISTLQFIERAKCINIKAKSNACQNIYSKVTPLDNNAIVDLTLQNQVYELQQALAETQEELEMLKQHKTLAINF